MLVHRAIVERILWSEGSSKPADESAADAFSALVEKRLLLLTQSLVGESLRSSGSPGVSEEALLHDLGYAGSTGRFRGVLTVNEVRKVLG